MTLAVLRSLLQRHECTASRDDCPDGEDLAVLVRMGLVDTTGLSSTAICNVCDEAHPAQIVTDPITNELGWYCPDYGFVPSPQDERRTIRALPGRLVKLIADELGCTRRLERPVIDGLLWRIGGFEVANNDVTVFLAVRLRDTDDAQIIATAISAEPSVRNGLILTPTFSGSPALNIVECKIAALDELISIEGEKLVATTRRAAGLAGVRMKSGAGAPRHKSHDEAEALIKKRHHSGDAEKSDREEAKVISVIVGESAPGDRTIRKIISAVRAGH